jgi:prepilin-type N-terminal cleavage/methylation domain-containing protein
MRHAGAHNGMTVLELMIVLAILAGGAVLVRSGFRTITKADLVENSTELAAILKRTGQLAIEKGEMHRVLFDVDKQIYAVEVCQGETTLVRNEQVRPDEEAVKRALDKGNERLRGLPTQVLSPDPETATQRALAIAGHHVAGRMCIPVDKDVSGDATGKAWIRTLRAAKGIKFKEIWVQHKDDSVTRGQVAIYFFPTGTAEKAVVEITDGSETFSVLVHGLTGRVQLKDGALRDVNDHMLRNVLGDKEARRESQR